MFKFKLNERGLFSNNFKALSDCFALQCNDVRSCNLIGQINMDLS